MKIITVLHSMKSGGAERHALQLMRGLRARGHEALYAGPMDGWLGQQLSADGFGGIDLPLVGLYDLPSITRLALYARRVGADLIHGHLTRGAWYAGLAAKLAGLPSVATAHSDNAGKHFGRARRIIAVSQAVADFLQRRGYDAARIRMVHHGIADITAHLPAHIRDTTRRELGLPPDEACLLMAARIVPAKGHDTALKALALLKDTRWTLLLAGDHEGDLGPEMQALAQTLGIADRVRFLGLREDVPALLKASDVLLAPSRREALSLTLLEASACSLPIVATRVGGIGEVVEDGASGFLVPPDDPAALAAALAPLLGDPALRARCGARARQRFEAGFTEKAMFDKTVAVYREACEGP
ncbi:glycosyltransferase [Zoogloea sp.]|uniref:glycosyltransferase n=1 Tax=Zoogloea sp. TaxID=49181 RepID=UPI002635D049|nr:glycosyltransferase [Zoogloea sp.]